MNRPFIIISLLIVLIYSCNNQNKERDSEKTNDINRSITSDSDAIKSDAINANLINTMDSLKTDKTIENSKYFIHACERLFDFDSIQIEQEFLTTDFFKANINVSPFDSSFLVWIKYEDWSAKERKIELFLIDEGLNIISQGEIKGCHYHNGTIEVVDWNQDGFDEIKFNIKRPTQSVAFIVYIERVFKLSTSTGLKQIFEIELETRDCTPTIEEFGRLIERKYHFKNSNTLGIKETSYKMKCEDFKFLENIKNKKRIKTIQYKMKWNHENGQFEK